MSILLLVLLCLGIGDHIWVVRVVSTQRKFSKSQMLCTAAFAPRCQRARREIWSKKQYLRCCLAWCFISGPKMEADEWTKIRFLVNVCGGGISTFVTVFRLNIIVGCWDSFIFSFSWCSGSGEYSQEKNPPVCCRDNLWKGTLCLLVGQRTAFVHTCAFYTGAYVRT